MNVHVKRTKKKQSGLTILELIIVVAILAVATYFSFNSGSLRVGNYRLF